MIDEPQENRLRLIHRTAREYLRDIAGGRFRYTDSFCMLTPNENDGNALYWPRADLECFEERMGKMVDYALSHQRPAYWAAGGYLADGSCDMSETCERSRVARVEALAKGLWVTPALAAEYRAQQEGSGEAPVEPGAALAPAQPQAEGKLEVGDVVRWLGEEHEVTCASPRGYPDHVQLSGTYVVQSKNLALVRRAEPKAQPSAEPQAAEPGGKGRLFIGVDPASDAPESIKAWANRENDAQVAALMRQRDSDSGATATLLLNLAREQQPRRVVAHPHPGRNFALTKRWEET